MELVVDSEEFLAEAFQTGDGPFLPVKVAAVDPSFVKVLLSPETAWQGRAREVEYSQIVIRMRGDTGVFEQMTPISRMPYTFARSTILDMTHAPMRVNSFFHHPNFSERLFRKKLNILTGVI
jgi:hypothetical protein